MIWRFIQIFYILCSMSSVKLLLIELSFPGTVCEIITKLSVKDRPSTFTQELLHPQALPSWTLRNYTPGGTRRYSDLRVFTSKYSNKCYLVFILCESEVEGENHRGYFDIVLEIVGSENYSQHTLRRIHKVIDYAINSVNNYLFQKITRKKLKVKCTRRLH